MSLSQPSQWTKLAWTCVHMCACVLIVLNWSWRYQCECMIFNIQIEKNVNMCVLVFSLLIFVLCFSDSGKKNWFRISFMYVADKSRYVTNIPSLLPSPPAQFLCHSTWALTFCDPVRMLTSFCLRFSL